MDTLLLIVVSFLLLLLLLPVGVNSYAMVSGTVFCDQCKDGQLSLFDYPQQGVKVKLGCDGQDWTWEETTNWLGNYVMRFDGTPNLSGCYVQLLPNGQPINGGCGSIGGPPNHLRLIFNMFGMEMYTVDPLLAQPPAPMSFCQTSPAPPFPPFSLPLPPPSTAPPFPPFRIAPFPPFGLPLPPPSPPMPPPSAVPFMEASACPPQKWIMPEYRCYWRVVAPDTKVAVVFGLVAAGKYGTDISLGEGLVGRGDPYRTLLREATTALLNSYNSVQFPYNTIEVIQNMNWGLTGSTRQVLHTALGFMKANSGIGTNISCRFTPCN